MEELIRRSDAIKAMGDAHFENYGNACIVLMDIPAVEPWDLYDCDEWCRDCKEYDTEKHNCPRWNRVIRRTLEENQPKQAEWIPCSERLPSEYSDDERVLATTDVDGLGVVLIPAYDVKSWYRKGYINAWMPLPKPYKEGADE